MKTTVTIRRPDGNIETVDMTEKLKAAGYGGIFPALFKNLKKATREAGLGEMLSYENINDVVDDRTEAEKAHDEAMILYDRAQDLCEYGGDSYYRAKAEAEKAMAAWREQYPDEAAQRDEQARAESAERDEQIKSSLGYRLMAEGRD